MMKFPMKILKTIASFWSFNSLGQSSDKKTSTVCNVDIFFYYTRQEATL
jgi:hypothetical protein